MSDFDRDAVIRRIAGLMEKTVANGCTEAEAMAASAAVGAMLNRYQMSLSDIKIKEEVCEQLDIRTSSKDGGPIQWVTTAIAYFTDTKTWRSFNAGPFNSAVFRFFGLKTDTIVAGYIYDVCQNAMLFGWQDYRLSIPGFTHMPGGRKEAIKKGFYIGMANRLQERLRAMKDAQRAENKSNGRDLVLVKSAKVDEEYEKLGLKLSYGKTRAVKMDGAAYRAGQEAADRVGINPGVGQSSNKSLR